MRVRRSHAAVVAEREAERRHGEAMRAKTEARRAAVLAFVRSLGGRVFTSGEVAAAVGVRLSLGSEDLFWAWRNNHVERVGLRWRVSGLPARPAPKAVETVAGPPGGWVPSEVGSVGERWEAFKATLDLRRKPELLEGVGQKARGALT